MSPFRRHGALSILLAAAIAGGCGQGKPSTTGSTSTNGGSPTAPTTPPTTETRPTTPPPTTCSYAVTVTPDDFELDGGNGTVAIATAAGCKWTLKTDAPWAAIEGPTQGEGPASVKLFV